MLSFGSNEKACIKKLIKVSGMDANFLAKNLLQCGFIIAKGERKFIYHFKGTEMEMTNGIENYEMCTEVLDELNKFLEDCRK